jgi:5-methylcytosine-specific restriction endonuclease McrA
MAYVLKYDRVRCCDCSAPTVITPKGRKGKRCAPCMRKLRGPKTQRRKCGEGWVDRSCLHCRREFRRLERGPSDRARYCSAACAAKAFTLGNRNKGRLQWGRGAKHVYTCRACGVLFYRKPGAGSQGLKVVPVHCSRSCRYSGLRFSSEKSSPSPCGARRARRSRGNVTPLSILERDGWKCRMCGCDTPRSLRGTTLANAPECDHVIPLSRGGSSTASNMQCLCRRCNALKGSKLPCELSQRQPAGDAIDHPLGGRIVEAGGAYASP